MPEKLDLWVWILIFSLECKSSREAVLGTSHFPFRATQITSQSSSVQLLFCYVATTIRAAIIFINTSVLFPFHFLRSLSFLAIPRVLPTILYFFIPLLMFSSSPLPPVVPALFLCISVRISQMYVLCSRKNLDFLGFCLLKKQNSQQQCNSAL